MRCGNMRKRQPGGPQVLREAWRPSRAVVSEMRRHERTWRGLLRRVRGASGSIFVVSCRSGGGKLAYAALDDLRGETDNLVQLVEVDSFGK